MPFFRCFFYALFVGFALYFIGESLPRRFFHADRFPFAPWSWEKNGTVYEILHVQDWKDHVPDMSRIMKNMVPKRLGFCPTSAQVRTLVQETCVAEFVHLVLCLFAPGIYLLWRTGMGLFLMIVYVLGNLAFAIIQRYNRPALLALAKRLEVREERKRNASAHSVG